MLNALFVEFIFKKVLENKNKKKEEKKFSMKKELLEVKLEKIDKEILKILFIFH